MTRSGLFAISLLAGGLLFLSSISLMAQEKQRRDPQQFARGAKAWASQCARCHRLRGANEMTDAHWSVVMSHMRLHANLPGKMARDIEVFLKASN